jgi:hypothetical protein
MDGRIVQSRGLPVTTDDRGYYRISALSPGAYMVCAEFMDAFGNEWHRTMAPEASSVVDYGGAAQRASTGDHATPVRRLLLSKSNGGVLLTPI